MKYEVKKAKLETKAFKQEKPLVYKEGRLRKLEQFIDNPLPNWENIKISFLEPI